MPGAKTMEPPVLEAESTLAWAKGGLWARVEMRGYLGVGKLTRWYQTILQFEQYIGLSYSVSFDLHTFPLLTFLFA